MRELFKGVTSYSQYLVLRDSTTGLGLTGKVFGDVTGSYTRNRAARTAITMATLASASAAYSSGGFIEVDATNCPGLYRFDIPDAAFATGAASVIVSVKVTGAITEHLEFLLVDWNKQVASVPNVAAGANGGLPTVDANNAVKVQSGTGANQISLASGLVTLAGVTHTGAVIPTVTAVTNDVGITQAGADKVWSSATRTLTAFSLTLAQQVWDVLAANVAAANSIGLQLKTNIDAAISSRSSHTAADVWASGTRTLTSFGTLAADVATAVWGAATRTLTAISDSAGVTTLLSRLTAGRATNLDNLDAAVSTRLATAGYTAPPTAAANADAVWDEAISGHLTAGSTGAALNAAGSAGDPWSTPLPGAYGSGTAGKIIGDNLNATVGSRATQTSVDDIPTNAELTTALASADDAVLAAIAALNNLSSAQVQTAATAALNAYDGPTNAELATALAAADDAVLAAIAALNDLAAADVTAAVPSAAAIAAGVVAAALTELAQAQPSAAPTVGEALMLPYMVLRNGGTFDKDTGVSTYRNGAGTVVFKRTDTDDGAVLTEGVLVSGP